ncbi:MAG TPA: pyridoxamine 5-phosphate oxidase [Cyanobacteria bacterium UBA11372]|nr:pyridoxamine 5-phosphate oxidase [Cyanobacteria bacterium UBA11372]
MTFHSGEIAIQTRAGVREEAERLCSFISDVIKPPAEEFLATQQLAVASTVDANERVWASLLTGNYGFLQVLNHQRLQINANLTPGDMLYRNLQNNPQMGVLAIALANRRRLRLNGKAQIQPEGQIHLQIHQVFFNCPKYIQVRHLETEITNLLKQPEISSSDSLTAHQQNWITQADTFFIASSHPEIGADASHRGGFPGFVRVLNSNSLLFPDYAGNNMFQTFGNLIINPYAGLLFIDFAAGDILQLTGQAKVIWDAERLTTFAGAQRLVEFEIEQVLETRNVTPMRWRFGEYSPANPG